MTFHKQISGLETNVNFLIDLARHESFQKADVHTGFIQQHFDTLFPVKVVNDDMLLQGAISSIVNENNAALMNALRAGQLNNPFAMNLGFRVNSSAIRTVVFKTENKEEKVHVMQVKDGFKAKVNDGEWRNVQVKTVKDDNRFSLKLNVDGSVVNFSAVITPEAVTIFNEVSFWTAFLNKINENLIFRMEKPNFKQLNQNSWPQLLAGMSTSLACQLQCLASSTKSLLKSAKRSNLVKASLSSLP